MMGISKQNRIKYRLLPAFLLLLGVFAAFAAAKRSENIPAAISAGLSETGETSAGGEELQVHFIDVGQSDATLITCGGHAMLFDAGSNSQGTALQAYLQNQGISKLDYVIGAHPDEDHIGGMDVVITKFDCGAVIMPECGQNTLSYRDVVLAMKFRGCKNTPPVVGDSYELGNARFTIIAPNREYEESNNWSVGIILQYGDNRFLFTGDAEAEAEADILNNGIDLSCDVYQAGHHGSYTSSSAALLDAARPKYAVVSCGKDNLYGHPHKSVLNRLKRRDIKVFRTDEQGTIVAKSDGKRVTFNCAPSETWRPGTVPESGGETEENGELQSDVTYVLNTGSLKFHRPDCDSLPVHNREDVTFSREEILSQGYTPCRRCKP